MVVYTKQCRFFRCIDLLLPVCIAAYILLLESRRRKGKVRQITAYIRRLGLVHNEQRLNYVFFDTCKCAVIRMALLYMSFSARTGRSSVWPPLLALMFEHGSSAQHDHHRVRSPRLQEQIA